MQVQKSSPPQRLWGLMVIVTIILIAAWPTLSPAIKWMYQTSGGRLFFQAMFIIFILMVMAARSAHPASNGIDGRAGDCKEEHF